MSNYQDMQAGEIRICYDPHRADFQWYARIPLVNPHEEIPFRRLSAEKNALEVELRGPKLLQANPKIIDALKSRGISTTQLTIRPYQG